LICAQENFNFHFTEKKHADNLRLMTNEFAPKPVTIVVAIIKKIMAGF